MFFLFFFFLVEDVECADESDGGGGSRLEVFGFMVNLLGLSESLLVTFGEDGGSGFFSNGSAI